MQVESPDKIRNIALAGHNDTGKTTLASAFLYTAGLANRLNKVDDGATVTDFDPEEVERKISIGLATCFVPWRGHKLNLVDCPGYGIFFTETEAALRAVDTVVLCVNAVGGVEVTTEATWTAAEKMALPVVINLTKMDRERAELDRNLESLRKNFGREVAPIQLPIGREGGFSGVIDLVRGTAWSFEPDGDGKAREIEIPADLTAAYEEARNQLVEAVAESDEGLLEKYFEEGELSAEDLLAGLRKAVASRQVFPVVVSSGLHGIGTSTLMDAVVDVTPSPADRAGFPARSVGGEEIEISADPEGPNAALVFKTLSDPFAGKVTLMRVVRGTLMSDKPLWNTRQEEMEKVGHLMMIQGKQGSSVDRLIAGDIGAVAKLKHAHTGDTLCAKEEPVRLRWIRVPEPAIAYALEPKAKGDEEKIGDSLQRLMEEDLTLSASRDADTGEFLLSGTGQLHVEIAVAKLKKRFGVEVVLHPPKVPYRETIRRPADGHGRHKKQTGGRGQFADCKIRIEPMERGGDFEFVDEIFGGSIPQQFRPAVEKGILETRAKGYLAGCRVVDFRVRLKDGQFHDVDSSEMAFKIAGSLAFKDAMAKADATILEPLMKVVITTTEEFMGDIMSDLASRRGRPQGMESKEGNQLVTATVPMSEMLNYAPGLRSMTQGRASFHMTFSHYEEVPRHIQDKLIAEVERAKAE